MTGLLYLFLFISVSSIFLLNYKLSAILDVNALLRRLLVELAAVQVAPVIVIVDVFVIVDVNVPDSRHVIAKVDDGL